MDIEVVVADLDEALPTVTSRGVLVQYPGACGRVARPEPGDRARPRARRTGRRRGRPARPDRARVARRAGRRCGARLEPALRRPAVLRRPARRLHGGRGRPRAAPARPAGRSLGRRGGPPGLPARPADPRAAHPPRQGHLEHLHRSGAARRGGVDVCRLPRPGRASAIAERTHRYAAVLAAALRGAGVEVEHDDLLRHPRCSGPRSGSRDRRARARARAPPAAVDADRVGLSSVGETSAPHVARVLAAFGVDAGLDARRRRHAPTPIPDGAARVRRTTSPTRCSTATTPRPRCCATCAGCPTGTTPSTAGMIPLGSCTMKLNATTEMEPITLPGFADLHPFAPAERRRRLPRADRPARGVARRGHRLRPRSRSSRTPARRVSWPGCSRSAATTRRAATPGRDVCLIPSQRHGTNAASAVMAGMRVVVVKAADDGAVDLDDLRAKCDEHARRAGGDHGHLPLDPRRLRGHHHRALRDRARARRPGVRRRREPQRAARARQARTSSAATSPTSTCTRRSASRTAAVARASARSASRPTWRRTCRATRCTPTRRSARASARSARRRTARRASCRSPGPTSR